MDPSPYTPSTFQNIILTVLAIMVILICFGCVYAFFHAIILFIFSQGKDEKIKSAWSSIRYMIWGIILTITLLFVFPIFFRWLGVDNAEEYSASSIFDQAGKIITKVSSFKNVLEKSQKLNQTEGRLYYTDEQLEPFTLDTYEL